MELMIKMSESLEEQSNFRSECENLDDEPLNDYEITINLHCLPARDIDEAKMEIWDILQALNQLPYDFDVHFKKVGQWV